MKTKQEQIEEMTKLINSKEIYPCEDDVHCENCFCSHKDTAEKLYNAGYRKADGAEIERLKAENEELTKVVSSKVYDLIDNAREIADAREAWEKQAKIDVLNELKNRLVVYYPSVISGIDELLKEYEK